MVRCTGVILKKSVCSVLSFCAEVKCVIESYLMMAGRVFLFSMLL